VIKSFFRRMRSLIAGWLTDDVQSSKSSNVAPSIRSQRHRPDAADDSIDVTNQHSRTTTEKNRTGSREDQFQCAVCDVWLLTPDDLRTHYRAGHDNTPNLGDSLTRVGGVGGIVCPDCGFEFELPRDQELHRIRTHKIESTN